jgi:hypothetical protein
VTNSPPLTSPPAPIPVPTLTSPASSDPTIEYSYTFNWYNIVNESDKRPGKDLSKTNIMFLTHEWYACRHPLTTLEAAQSHSDSSSWWTEMVVDLTVPRAMDFYKRVQDNTALQMLFYFDTIPGITHTQVYAWEWVRVSLFLFCFHLDIMSLGCFGF